jgi:hypothetical protein
MIRFLYHEPETRELRLVMTDYWDGHHERTEFRVLSGDGTPLRNCPDLDGTPVHEHRGQPEPYYIKVGLSGGERRFAVENLAAGPTVKTPCPVAAAAGTRKRPKCGLCP